MQINTLRLDEIIKRVTSPLDEFVAYVKDVEIINSLGESNNAFENSKFFRYILKLTLHGCVLVFGDLDDIMMGLVKAEGSILCLITFFKIRIGSIYKRLKNILIDFLNIVGFSSFLICVDAIFLMMKKSC